jgi:hypothetical protein
VYNHAPPRAPTTLPPETATMTARSTIDDLASLARARGCARARLVHPATHD